MTGVLVDQLIRSPHRKDRRKRFRERRRASVTDAGSIGEGLLWSSWPVLILLFFFLLFLLRHLLLLAFLLVFLATFVSHACSFSAIMTRDGG